MRRNNEHEYVRKDKLTSAWKEGDWLDKNNSELCGNNKRERLKKNICKGISRFKIKKEYKHNFGINTFATHQ